MTADKKIFYLIAGEASGDALGAKLVAALKNIYPEAEFHGVGGDRMIEAGMTSLFPMHEISIMGFVEILSGIFRVWQRIKQTAADIRQVKPDVVITIDAQSFSRRVAKYCQLERSAGTKFVQYVAPSVWAYKPERALWFSRLYDLMLCLLPFEAGYFEDTGLKARFVGHPVLEEEVGGDGAAFRQRHNIADNIPLIGLFPGSRRSEIKRHLPLFQQTIGRLNRNHPKLQCVVLALPVLEKEIRHWAASWPVPLHVVTSLEEKPDMLAACDVALSKSGTVTLELALAQLPMVVVHKMNALSMWLIRRMIRVRFATLINLLESREVVPEVLQELAKPVILENELHRLLKNSHAAAEQVESVAYALEKLQPEVGASPSAAAARAVADLLEGRL